MELRDGYQRVPDGNLETKQLLERAPQLIPSKHHVAGEDESNWDDQMFINWLKNFSIIYYLCIVSKTFARQTLQKEPQLARQ